MIRAYKTFYLLFIFYFMFEFLLNQCKKYNSFNAIKNVSLIKSQFTVRGRGSPPPGYAYVEIRLLNSIPLWN